MNESLKKFLDEMNEEFDPKEFGIRTIILKLMINVGVKGTEPKKVKFLISPEFIPMFAYCLITLQ